MHKVFQLSRAKRVACSVPLVFVAIGLAASVLDTSLPVGVRAAGPLGAVLVVLVVIRTWLVRVVATSEHVEVVNFLRSRQYSWGEVERFVYDGGLTMRLCCGKEVGASAFSWVPGAFPVIARRRAQRAAAELESLRSTRQAAIRRKARGGR